MDIVDSEILTVSSHHFKFSFILLYDYVIQKMQNVYIPVLFLFHLFFLLVFYNQSMESCDILDQFSAALFVSAVLLKHFKFHNTSAIH